VSGFVIPFFIEQKVNGNTAFKVVIEQAMINENLDDSIFAYPKK
jgi:hypothetical protein